MPRFLTRQLLGLTLALVALRASGAGEGPNATVDFAREIQPLLSDFCYRCHGPDAGSRKSGLRLDQREAALAGGKSGLPAIVPGKPDQSELIARIYSSDPEEVMPSADSHRTLSDLQKERLARWVAEGAVWADHWAFVAPVRPSLPPRPSGPSHPIDAFVDASLAAAKIAPSPEADRRTLLRRVTFDLTGLPPTPQELEAFLADSRPDAYERVVDTLLASPHHGERWARPWLDVARYADSNGYSVDAPRQIWKYRDWVVTALNRDLPYDQFVIEQLAGDLLPDATRDQRVATGFNRNTQINQEGGIDPEQFRVESVNDRVGTFGSAFLGLTLACAQCHDHKFDPVTQREYYQLYAFFNQTVADGHGSSKPGGILEFPDEARTDASAGPEVETARFELYSYLESRDPAAVPWRPEITPSVLAQLKPEMQHNVQQPWAQLTAGQRRQLYGYFVRDDAEYNRRLEKLTALERAEQRVVTTLVMSELAEPRTTHLFIKGDFTRPGEIVSPGTPAILPPLHASGPRATRLDLARWLFDPAQPLTARVFVNRVWQVYFGRGLVETENDFGLQGARPTHPELLDWLATEFSRQGWSMKALHRLIVTSSAYRRASNARPDLDESDPLNRLLTRQSRLRLDAEWIRDLGLAVSGLLVPRLGGPPVFPPQPDNVMGLGQVNRAWLTSEGDDRHRRALYTHHWRATPHPATAVFDAPDGFSACTRRLRSNTPLQALTLLNDRQFFEFAQALGARLRREAADDDARLRLGFRLCVAREPTPPEHDRLRRLLVDLRRDPNADDADPEIEVWTTIGRVLLNLDETLNRS
ncbi:MAG: DUF1549 domain-containing protein [Verrucomicrobia bacterium]|nr:DUF1549 domain-containing protein [Verrucomicrobiota bacterium]